MSIIKSSAAVLPAFALAMCLSFGTALAAGEGGGGGSGGNSGGSDGNSQMIKPIKCKAGQVPDPQASPGKGKCVNAANIKKPAKQKQSMIYDYGKQLAKAGEYQLAIDTLRLAPDQNDPRVLNYLGYSHRKLGKMGEALEYYHAAVAQNPDFSLVREYLGEAYIQLGELGDRPQPAHRNRAHLRRAAVQRIWPACGPHRRQPGEVSGDVPAARSRRRCGKAASGGLVPDGWLVDHRELWRHGGLSGAKRRAARPPAIGIGDNRHWRADGGDWLVDPARGAGGRDILRFHRRALPHEIRAISTNRSSSGRIWRSRAGSSVSSPMAPGVFGSTICWSGRAPEATPIGHIDLQPALHDMRLE